MQDEKTLNLSLLREIETEYQPSKRPKNIADGGDSAIGMNAHAMSAIIWFGFAIAAAVLVAVLLSDCGAGTRPAALLPDSQ
jgi:hypothetical protein